jgi:hypothetical protein
MSTEKQLTGSAHVQSMLMSVSTDMITDYGMHLTSTTCKTYNPASLKWYM